jgi:hypothetical protein
MSYSLGVQTHAALVVRVHRSVPTNLMPNAKRMRALVYSIQPSLFIRVIGFIRNSSQKDRPRRPQARACCRASSAAGGLFVFHWRPLIVVPIADLADLETFDRGRNRFLLSVGGDRAEVFGLLRIMSNAPASHQRGSS